MKLIATLVLVLGTLYAQTPSKRIPLETAPDPGKVLNEPGKQCGKYFWVFPAIDAHGPMVSFNPSGTVLRGISDNLHEHAFVEVWIEKTEQAPTVEELESGNIRFHMRQEEYNAAAACLPKPATNTK